MKFITIGLLNAAAAILATELYVLFPNFQIHYQNLRGLHWKILGKRFLDLHLILEELYNDRQIIIDLNAERVLTL